MAQTGIEALRDIVGDTYRWGTLIELKVGESRPDAPDIIPLTLKVWTYKDKIRHIEIPYVRDMMPEPDDFVESVIVIIEETITGMTR